MGFNSSLNFYFNPLSGIGSNFATPGYSQLPSGLILQWGEALGVKADNSAAAVVTLPKAFPNAILNVQVTNNSGSGFPSGTVLGFTCFNLTLPSFSLIGYGGSAGQTFNLNWFAIGY